jgi:hypothetical protein
MINKKIINFSLIGLALLFILFFLTYIRVNTDIGLMGDTGLQYALLQRIHDAHGPNLNIYASINDTLFSKGLATKAVSEVCNIASNLYIYSSKELNFFNFHTYFIFYPISLLVYVIETPYIIQGVGIFSFLSFAVLSYLICKSHSKSTFISIFATIIITLHPAWSWSIMGQPFIDKLFLPLGLLVFYYCDNNKLFKSLIFAIIASLINEKIGIYLALFYCSYSFLFLQKNSYKYSFSCLIAGIFFAALSYLIVNKVLNNPYYSSVILNNPNAILGYFSNEIHLNGLITFLAINFAIIFLSLYKNKRYFILALIMMQPNIFSDIGGAEKVNFYTHYHALYFPFVVFCFIKSLENYNRLVCKRFLVYFYIPLTIIILTLIDINQSRQIIFNYKLQNLHIANLYRTYLSRNNYNIHIIKINKLIPVKSKITSSESGLPYLYKFDDLNLYPLNLKDSDYVVTPYTIIDGKYFYRGYFGYLGEAHNKNVNSCLNLLMRNSGFKVDEPIYLTPNFAVIGK